VVRLRSVWKNTLRTYVGNPANVSVVSEKRKVTRVPVVLFGIIINVPVCFCFGKSGDEKVFEKRLNLLKLN